ncbi:MlaD family protein [Candidatus Babeliales bacterium]|nr:MlaD family protein [Candidatus Babeliales bacterium]MCF7899755.1 MlaD family protein [Candidatus Babeliales bacterium]
MRVETRVGIFIVIAIGVFIYLSVNIGALRLDKAQYDIYRTYFEDTGGLDTKAPVKIAGVSVGWVESINLLPEGKAEINMRVEKNIKLAKNAYTMISQEGLIGTKTLVIEPGDPSTGYLIPGSTLSMPGKTPATVTDLLEQFKDIASNVQDIAFSFKGAFGTQRGEENLKLALNGIAKAADRMADFSEVLNRTVQKNEDNINCAISDLRSVMRHLDNGIPSITNNFNDTFPAIKHGALVLADNTLPKVGNASDKVGTAFQTIDETAVQARETFSQAEQVVEKINTGKGVLGKIINEDETYDDIKKSIRGLKDYLTKAQSLVLDVDMHSESLLGRDWNSKGYMSVRLRPTQDYFYQIQLVSDERGSIIRDEEHRQWYDKDNNEITLDNVGYQSDDYAKAQESHDKLEFARTVDKTTRRKNDILFGFQFGKRFDRLAFRIGMFESTFGVACDYYVPMNTDKFHWITTLEAFDFKGTKRLYDQRPYVKWINKIFFMKNIYTAFGMDDMFGKETSAPFFGGGIRFGDDDLKYVLSSLPVGKLTGD